MDFKVALIGAGNMGGAMLRGWVANGLPPSNITVIDPIVSAPMEMFLADQGISYSGSAEGVSPPDVLLVAVKPQVMGDVLPTIAGLVSEATVVVSVAAGTQLEFIENHLGPCAAIRCMPNTPSLVLQGMTVACPNEQTTELQRRNVDQLLQAIGKVDWVDDEGLIDAVTAVSGSGPAYVFHLAECMAEAGEKVGLPRDLAMTLAKQTIKGAGELMAQSTDTPATLRENVTSPNGTTAAALAVLMAEEGMPKLLEEAIEAAKQRSIELS